MRSVGFASGVPIEEMGAGPEMKCFFEGFAAETPSINSD
jgi:hypothetical protein